MRGIGVLATLAVIGYSNTQNATDASVSDNNPKTTLTTILGITANAKSSLLNQLAEFPRRYG